MKNKIIVFCALVFYSICVCADDVESTSNAKEKALIFQLHTVCNGEWDSSHTTYTIDADQNCIDALQAFRKKYENLDNTEMVSIIERFASQYGIDL